MPRTAEDIENYLHELNRDFEVDAGTYVIHGPEDRPPIAIRVVPPIVAVRVVIGATPTDEKHQATLYRRLLELNATDLMHVSYGLEKESVILSAGLELENLDLNELEATLSDVDLALARHVPELRAIALR